MSTSSLFTDLSSSRIAELIHGAENRVIYAAPGIQIAPAAAMVESRSSLFSPELTVNLDFDERTLRMGYGSLEAVAMLRESKIEPLHFPGFRSGILIVDNRGWIFSPVAHYLEDEPQSEETPNAIELSTDQVKVFAIRFSPESRQQAIEEAPTPELAAELAEMPSELGVAPVMQAYFEQVKKAIQTAPPVKFDIVRQVRVFEPYLQYVEMSLTGAAIQKHRVQIPPDIQKLGSSKDLEGRLRTTFELLGKSSSLSSKTLEDDLNKIRANLTPSLGKNHGRVVLKSAKPLLETRLDELRDKLVKHQEKVKEKLQADLDKSREEVVEYYLPLAKAKPPDAVVGQSLSQEVSEDHLKKWLNRRLEKVFPAADDLASQMTLDVNFKDVTFETLNQEDFLDSVKKAFPDVDWDKAYDEFRAAGETKKSKSTDETGVTKP
jgi:hypothetical protein